MENKGLLDNIIFEICRNQKLFCKLEKKIKKLVKHFKLDHAKSISKLIPENLVEAFCYTAPVTSLEWCTVNMTLANHRGDIQTSLNWKDKCASLRLKPDDDTSLIQSVIETNVEKVADFFNHAFVADHNRYYFNPDLPDNLTEILNRFEKLHRVQCESGCSVFPVLGRIYGTLIQNYAFCGPEFIKKVENYSKKPFKIS